MIHSAEVSGVTYSFMEPETAAEVLHYKVRLRAMVSGDVARLLSAAVEYASKYVRRIDKQDVTRVQAIEVLTALAQNPEDLFSLCRQIADSPSLPDSFLSQYRKLLLRDGKLEKFKPSPWCKCPRCTGDNPDAAENACLFFEIDPTVSLVMNELLGLDEAGAMLDQPYWFVQLRAEQARVRSRAHQKKEDDKRRVKETEKAWDRVRPGWRDRIGRA